MKKQKFSRSVAKYIRMQKAKIRRNDGNIDEQKQAIKALYVQFAKSKKV